MFVLNKILHKVKFCDKGNLQLKTVEQRDYFHHKNEKKIKAQRDNIA